MDIILIIVVSVFLIVSLVGCFFPVVPGPPLAYFSLLVFNKFYNNEINNELLIMIALIVLLITVLDYWLQIYGVKIFGGGKYSKKGTLIGIIFGLFFTPFGIILGPFFGAFIGSKFERNSNLNSLKIAFGSLLGFISGTILKLIITIWIIILFLKQIV